MYSTIRSEKRRKGRSYRNLKSVAIICSNYLIPGTLVWSWVDNIGTTSGVDTKSRLIINTRRIVFPRSKPLLHSGGWWNHLLTGLWAEYIQYTTLSHLRAAVIFTVGSSHSHSDDHIHTQRLSHQRLLETYSYVGIGIKVFYLIKKR